MNNIDLFLMGIKNLWRRKLRTFLTVLGVVIGASSIIVMLSLGFGMTKSFEDEIAQWGDLTTINVMKKWMDPSMPGQDKVAVLDDKAVMDFQKIPNVEAVSPILETYGTIYNGRYQSSMPIRGVNPDSMEAFGFKAEEGRLLNGTDKLMLVFGSDMPHSFYDPNSRVWREPNLDLMKDRMTLSIGNNYYGPGDDNKKPKEYKVQTAGILTSGDWETSYGVYMPLLELEKLIAESQKSQGREQRREKTVGYDQVKVKVNSIDYVEDIQDMIIDMGHEAYSLNDQLKARKEQSLVLRAVLGGIGAISLLVAAIGIINTMVMSIYERTKEIGVMKVIGASIKDIKRLFLFESALIGLIGGVFGVGISYAISYLMNRFGSQFVQMGMMGPGGLESTISIIPAWLALAALVFSALIGIISGYFPARRAMKLSALDAIRTE